MKTVVVTGGRIVLVSDTRTRAITGGYLTLSRIITDAAAIAHNPAHPVRGRDGAGFFEIASMLAAAHTGASTLASRMPLYPDRDLGVARDLVRTLSRARMLALELPVSFGTAPGAAAETSRQALDLVAVLETAWNRSSILMHDIGLLQEYAPIPGRRSGARQSTAGSARRLLRVAARLLPDGDRARYAEEFGSELADIALAGGARLSQLAYAARQLRSAPRLRADLKSPRRRSAAP